MACNSGIASIQEIHVTHGKFRHFRRIGGICKLGQYDLLKKFINLQGHTMSLVQPMEPAYGRLPVTFRESNSTLSGSI